MSWDPDDRIVAPDWMVAELARMTAIDDQVRAQLRDQAAADRAAAPDPSEVAETVHRMALNGIVDPDDEG